MRARLAPLIYDDADREAAARLRNSVVAKAQRSPAARRKETTGLTEDGLPVHSFQSLLADLATYSRIQAATAINENYVFTLYSRPTPTQARALNSWASSPTVPSNRPSLGHNASEISYLRWPEKGSSV